jgi:dihydropyrimidinase
MSEFDRVIKGGTIATASDTFSADIGIKDGRVAALGENLSGDDVIDATGKLVLPGGIDAHVHIDQPKKGGIAMADDFRSGTRSAAAGGTTTIMPFACQYRGESLRQVVEDYHKKADGKAVVDYAFHLIIADANEQVMGQELPALIEDGYTSFKIYMTYPDLKLNDRECLEIFSLARRTGAMTMVHAENADCIEWMTEQLLMAGKTGPKYHAVSRPPVVEKEATHRAISLAEFLDVPILIVHVSSAEAMEQIAIARQKGLRIYGETCPQYLFLTADDLELDDEFEGAKYICSPPPRDKANQEKIWQGLANSTFDVLASDHAPYSFDGPDGKKVVGEDAPFNKIPNGVPGIETRLPLLFSGGVSEGRISLQKFVALTATNPAKLYGLHPRKGTIAIGSDADIAIWDPEKKVTITNENLHHNVDYTPYEGIECTGWPVTVLSRGDVVVQDCEVVASEGRGQFLRCDKPDPARPGMGTL